MTIPRPICKRSHKNYHHTNIKNEFGNGTFRANCRRCDCAVFEDSRV
jgi:hypothetical protein